MMSSEKHYTYESHANPHSSSHVKVQPKMQLACEEAQDFKNLFRFTGYVEHLRRRCRKQAAHQDRDFRNVGDCGDDPLNTDS